VVSDAGKANKVQALAASIASEVKGAQVINRMTVATPNQVNLQVRVAEVNVTKLNEIGVNWQKIGQSLSFLTNNPVTVMGEATNFLTVGKVPGAQATISALEQEGFITNLAEPNLTAMSGQTASFLAGGEFPVPISGSSNVTSGFPTISVEFKSFGVSLAFTPTVIDANHLNLRVRPATLVLPESLGTRELSLACSSLFLDHCRRKNFLAAILLQSPGPSLACAVLDAFENPQFKVGAAVRVLDPTS